MDNIVENLNNALNYNNKLSHFISTIKLHTQALSDKNQEFSIIYSEIHKEITEINDICYNNLEKDNQV